MKRIIKELKSIRETCSVELNKRWEPTTTDLEEIRNTNTCNFTINISEKLVGNAYAGCTITVRMKFRNYPFQAPKVDFTSPIFHPQIGDTHSKSVFKMQLGSVSLPLALNELNFLQLGSVSNPCTQIFVRDETRARTITLDVEPNDTILHIKELLQDKLAIPCERQRLVSIEGEILKNDQTLSDYNIDHSKHVFLENLFWYLDTAKQPEWPTNVRWSPCRGIAHIMEELYQMIVSMGYGSPIRLYGPWARWCSDCYEELCVDQMRLSPLRTPREEASPPSYVYSETGGVIHSVGSSVGRSVKKATEHQQPLLELWKVGESTVATASTASTAAAPKHEDINTIKAVCKRNEQVRVLQLIIRRPPNVGYQKLPTFLRIYIISFLPLMLNWRIRRKSLLLLSKWRFPAYTPSRLSELWHPQYVAGDKATDACRRSEQVRVLRFLVRRPSPHSDVGYQRLPSSIRLHIMSFLQSYMYAVTKDKIEIAVNNSAAHTLWKEDFTEFAKEVQRLMIVGEKKQFI